MLLKKVYRDSYAERKIIKFIILSRDRIFTFLEFFKFLHFGSKTTYYQCASLAFYFFNWYLLFIICVRDGTNSKLCTLLGNIFAYLNIFFVSREHK